MSEKKLFLDFDGVLCNIISPVCHMWHVYGDTMGWKPELLEDMRHDTWTDWHAYTKWGLDTFLPPGYPIDGLYKNARPYENPAGINTLLTELASHGIEVYVLTVCSSEHTKDAKAMWLEEYYPSLADKVITVKRANEKLKYSNRDWYLLDDYIPTIDSFNKAEGVGQVCARPWNDEYSGGRVFEVFDWLLGHVPQPEPSHTVQTFAEDCPEGILEEAARLTSGDRQAAYGPADQDFQRTADMASALLADKLTAPLTSRDVAMFMILLKLSRQTHQSKRDNWVDIAGYAHCGNLCDDAAQAREERSDAV